MMTREEAIALLNEQYETCKRIYDCSADQRKSYPNVPQFMEALGMALTALRPVSREQVEKVWRGCGSCKSFRSCAYSLYDLKDVICKMCDPNAEGIVTEYKPSNFCPVCGKPLFGHHSGKQSRTFWGCFMKLEEMEMLEGME